MFLFREYLIEKGFKKTNDNIYNFGVIEIELKDTSPNPIVHRVKISINKARHPIYRGLIPHTKELTEIIFDMILLNKRIKELKRYSSPDTKGLYTLNKNNEMLS